MQRTLLKLASNKNDERWAMTYHIQHADIYFKQPLLTPFRQDNPKHLCSFYLYQRKQFVLCYQYKDFIFPFTLLKYFQIISIFNSMLSLLLKRNKEGGKKGDEKGSNKLPKNINPSNYTVCFKPHMGDLSFEGSVAIDLKVKYQSKIISKSLQEIFSRSFSIMLSK
jgi:hypothetical protein